MTRSAVLQRQNLIAKSQDFSGYTQTSITLAANTADTLDPLGGSHATKCTDTAANDQHRIYTSTATISEVYTLSTYVKAGTKSWFALDINDGLYVYFDLGAGVVGGTSVNVLSSNIVAVGNGWYRCSATIFNVTGPFVSVSFNMASGNGLASYTGDGTGTLYLFGTQVVISNWAGPYTATTGSVIGAVGAIRSLTGRAENRLLQSQTFTVSPWTSNVVIVSNADIAPDGTMTASTVTDNSAAAFLDVGQSVAVTASGKYTLSLFIKKTSGASVLCGFNLTGPIIAVSFRFNTDTGVVTSGVASVQSQGNYWKLIMPVTVTGAGTLVISFFPATGLSSGGGDVATATGTQTIWAMQLVQANWAGPYQVTTTTAVTAPIRSLASPNRSHAGTRSAA